MVDASRRWQTPLPTMYDLPSEFPEELGLPDQFHELQPTLLSITCKPSNYSPEDCLTAQDLNVYYDPHHTLWHKRPDWFLVLGATHVDQQDQLRWSYVIWQEGISPFLVVELLSPGTEAEDLGRSSMRLADKPPSKWQVYEQILQVPFYAVFDRIQNQFRLFILTGGRYQEQDLPERRFWFEELGLGLGVWTGPYRGVNGRWLRWYDRDWTCIPTPAEEAQRERQEAETARQQAEQERQRAEAAEAALNQAQSAAQQAQEQAIRNFLAMGLDVGQIAAALGVSEALVQRVHDGFGD